MPFAHVVSPPNVPAVVPWITALCLYGAALGAVVFWRDRTKRRVFGAVALAGLAGSVALYVTEPSVPERPGYLIDLGSLDGSTMTSPIEVQVCGVGTGSTPAPVPGPGRLLLIRVDGVQAAETKSSAVALEVAKGSHQIEAELITSDHRAFAPPILADATVTVTGPGPLTPPPPCTGQR